jgi:hypothetical protein
VSGRTTVVLNQATWLPVEVGADFSKEREEQDRFLGEIVQNLKHMVESGR